MSETKQNIISNKIFQNTTLNDSSTTIINSMSVGLVKPSEWSSKSVQAPLSTSICS